MAVAEANVVPRAAISPGRATSQRYAFEETLNAILGRVLGRFLADVNTLGIEELKRTAVASPSAVTASVGTGLATGIIGSVTSSPVTVAVIAGIWKRLTDDIIENRMDALLSSLPESLRRKALRSIIERRYLFDDDRDIFDLAYDTIAKAVRGRDEEGLSTREVERVMDEALSYLKPDGEQTEFGWRTERMARTASTVIYNDAMLEQLAEDGFTHKLWVTNHDDKVRDSHAHVDGVSVPLDEPFRVGGSYMMQPGDTSAPIGQWINCRCVIVGENGPSQPGIDWSIPVMSQSERIRLGYPADISMPAIEEQSIVASAGAALDRARAVFGAPDQIRAPEGTSIGGQWIDSPSGILHDLSAPGAPAPDDPFAKKFGPRKPPTSYVALGASTDLEPLVNPGRADDPGRDFNCAYVAAAMELQARGYDAVANTHAVNVGTMAGDIERQFLNADGSPRKFGTHRTSKDAMRSMSRNPPGSRFIVLGNSRTYGNGGHCWNAEILPNGDIQFIDGQTGKPIADQYLEQYMDLRFIRVDDAVLSSGLADGILWGTHPDGSPRYGEDWTLSRSEATAEDALVAAIGFMTDEPEPLMPDVVDRIDEGDRYLLVLSEPLYDDRLTYEDKATGEVYRELDPASPPALSPAVPNPNGLVASALVTLTEHQRPLVTFGYNPAQARAPKGTRIGGEWIETPTGLLNVANNIMAQPTFPGMERAQEDLGAGPGNRRIDSYEHVYAPENTQPNSPYYRALSSDDVDSMTHATRQVLADAASEGVSINMSQQALEDMGFQDYDTGTAQVRNMWQVLDHEREHGAGITVPPQVEYEDYTEAREDYEQRIIGQAPVYGMGINMNENALAQGRDYGNVTLVLNDDVLSRTGWVAGDGYEGYSRPIMTDEIVNADNEELLAASAWMGAAGGDFDPENWEKSFDKMPYVEAQILGGPVTIDDVREVYMPESVYRDLDVSAKDMLSKRNIPVHFELAPTATTGVDPGSNWLENLGFETTDTARARLDDPSSIYHGPGFEADEISTAFEGDTGRLRDALNMSEYRNEEYADTAVEWLNGKYNEQTYGSQDFTISVDTARIGDGRLEWSGRVLAESGYEMGEFTRTMSEDPSTGDIKVHHDLLKLDPEAQGLGFGTDFSRKSEEMYRDMGVSKIDLQAALDKGGYTWARAGYQWQRGSQLDLLTPKVKDAETKYRDRGDTDTADKLAHWLDNYDTGSRVSVPVEEVTMDFGSPQDMLDITDSLEESILKGSNWYGEKFLDGRDPIIAEDSLTAAASWPEWDTSRERSDLLYAFCDKYGVDYLEEWAPPMEALWTATNALARTAFYADRGVYVTPTTEAPPIG